jgi:hypothetical protein
VTVSGTSVIRAGQIVSDRCAVFVFQLPSLGAVTNPFATAAFSFQYANNLNSGSAHCDLYGLPASTSSSVPFGNYPGYYYGATPTPDSHATLLHDNLLTTMTAVGVKTTAGGVGTGAATLAGYLNTQYAAGAGAGKYVFLRFSTDLAGDGFRWGLASPGAAGSTDTRPQINYTLPPPNTPPTLAPMNDQTAISGQTILFTNSATDTDQPPQTLTYSLQDPPAGASINPTNGVFTWRPTIAQSAAGGLAYDITVLVTDNGTPPLSDANDFTGTVYPPQNPSLTNCNLTNGQFRFTVNGDSGSDYAIYGSSNLVDWWPVWTNSAAVPPFTFTDTTTNANQRFYRILLGP